MSERHTTEDAADWDEAAALWNPTTDDDDYDDEDTWDEDEDGFTSDPYYDDEQYDDDYLDYDHDDEPDYDPDDYMFTWRDWVRSWWWKLRHPRDSWRWWWYSFRTAHGLLRCYQCGKLRRFGNHDDCVPF